MGSTISIYNLWVLGLVLFSLFSCTLRSENQSGAPGIGVSESLADSTIHVTASGKEFTLIEDKSLGASLSIVTIKMAKFTEVNRSFAPDTIDPVEKVFLADLDQNGYEELYFTTRGAGSGSISTIYGFASNRDKSVSQVYVPEISGTQREPGGFYDGFMGHNSFSMEDGILVNTFPVYLEGDKNSSPSGEKRSVSYALKAGEASWILEPVGIR
jgi:hypothetical protein